MENYLLITLGHNSSAIFVDNSNLPKQKIIGYEQERLSRIKADSQFPIDAINEIKKNVTPAQLKGCKIRISHWFNFVDNCIPPNKYITQNDIDWLNEISTDIKFVDNNFTHHDAHAYSAYLFYMAHIEKTNNTPVHCIVADGFGNNGEVLSIYSYNAKKQDKEPQLLHRAYGYKNSLGLFYQYATSFVGMKENQDEYKFLGYEPHIEDMVNDSKILTLSEYIRTHSSELFNNILRGGSQLQEWKNRKNKAIDTDDLLETREYWYNIFAEILSVLGIDEQTCVEARCVIAYFIQSIIENVIEKLICEFNIKNVCVVGGLFYNVKLNKTVFESVDGYFSAMPLAGDQGAALGMYAKEEGFASLNFDNFLLWGKRKLYNIEKLIDKIPNAYFINEEQQDSVYVAQKIAKYIANGQIVNIVHGNMEFGPRALCNTSTLFLPTQENVRINNELNDRNEVMPCAPVCTEENAKELFGEVTDRTVGSHKYMICTYNYMRSCSSQYGGVMHKLPFDDVYTGRPQVVEKGTFIWHVLKEVERLTDVKCLVNTSFNVHGNPIVFDTMDIIRNFEYQSRNAISKKPILVVIK